MAAICHAATTSRPVASKGWSGICSDDCRGLGDPRMPGPCSYSGGCGPIQPSLWSVGPLTTNALLLHPLAPPEHRPRLRERARGLRHVREPT
jgi:hypothetical protein